MKKLSREGHRLALVVLLITIGCTTISCQGEKKESPREAEKKVTVENKMPEYFFFREEFEKAQGYTHAVKVGDILRVSGAVSMDKNGNPMAVGDLKQQMINCYADLKKILNHYDATFDDVIMENIYTTNMAAFLESKSYRQEIYTKQFPAGNWVGVKELVVPELLIEIGLEVYIPEP